MVHPLSRLGRRDDGAVAIITVVLVSFVFMGLAALVIDMGLGRDTRRQAQNAADASALAAGNALYPSGAVSPDFDGAIRAAKSYALANYGVPEADWTGLRCTDASALPNQPDFPNTCISFDYPTPDAPSTLPRTVRVRIPTRQVNTPFAGVAGVATVPVSAAANVKLDLAGDACGLCVIGEGVHDLQNGDVVVTGASVAINGQLDARNGGSITVSGGSNIIDLEGGVPNHGSFDPPPLENQPPVVDPLGNMLMPDYSALMPQPSAVTDPCTGGPGIYAGFPDSHGPAVTCTLQPGLYVLTGPSHLSGPVKIVANGVTLYFICGTPALPAACTTGQSGGDLLFTGQGTLAITAPTSGPLKGLSIVADRNNTATFDFRGNGAQDNSGTIYVPSGTLNYRGNGNGYALKSLVVVGSLSFNGNPSTFVSEFAVENNVFASSNLHLSQ
jgi:Putative Flp pilus-assembly TadE/G-like